MRLHDERAQSADPRDARFGISRRQQIGNDRHRRRPGTNHVGRPLERDPADRHDRLRGTRLAQESPAASLTNVVPTSRYPVSFVDVPKTGPTAM